MHVSNLYMKYILITYYIDNNIWSNNYPQVVHLYHV